MIPTKSRLIRFGGTFFILGWFVGPMRGAPEPVESAPELSLSLRGVRGGSIEPDEPFFVAVRVDVPDEATTSLHLAPARGSWVEATTVEILRTSDSSVSAQARSVPQAALEGTVIDAENPATSLWWFPGASLQAVLPGDYVVRARLAIRDGSGWKGEVVSESCPLRVIAASDDPERVTQRNLARAHAAIFTGEPAKAAEILDALLEKMPDNVPVLELRAALSLEGGNFTAAQICLDRAMLLAARAGGEPSVGLRTLAQRIDLALNADSARTAPPAWARNLPGSVFLPVKGASGNSATPKTPTVASSPTPVRPTPTSGGTGTTTATKQAVIPVIPTQAPSQTKQPAAVASSQTEGTIVSVTELVDANIRADENGQWAASATASSQYGAPRYAPEQATGAPNIPLGMAGDNPDAWCPASKNDGTAWLELTFAKPVHATEVRVRQNNAPGAIAKLEAIDDHGVSHLWWEGVDSYVAPEVREIAWFAVRVPKTDYLVAKVKITLNLAKVQGWKQIDAVQLVGSPP